MVQTLLAFLGGISIGTGISLAGSPLYARWRDKRLADIEKRLKVAEAKQKLGQATLLKQARFAERKAGATDARIR